MTVLIHSTAEVSVKASISDGTSIWHQYTIQVGGGRNRDAAVKQLNDAGVGTGIFYPIPAYRQAHLVEAGYGSLSFPVTDCMVNEVISLPVHPQLNQNDLEKIAVEVNKL